MSALRIRDAGVPDPDTEEPSRRVTFARSGAMPWRTSCSRRGMHRLIADEAGHRAVAAAMRYVDHTTYELERLTAERAAEQRRAAPRS